MKRTAPILLLLISVLLIPILILPFTPLAAATPGPADYPITVHVSSSEWNANWLQLSVTIDGKKYLLSGPYYGVLSPGDYKAKLVTDTHKTSYETYQTYEFLFPDNKTRKYNLIGQSE
jgi:hypothetical protein